MFSYQTNEYIPADADFLIFSYQTIEYIPTNAGFLIDTFLTENEYTYRLTLSF